MSENTTPPIPDLSGAISKIMEHPELLSMVASVLGEPSADNREMSEQTKESEQSVAASAPPTPPPPEVISTLAPMLSRLNALGSGGVAKFKHEQLLCALKPYLSSSRCDAIDYIIKFSQMSSLLKGFK